jgi:hypothetical protein
MKHTPIVIRTARRVLDREYRLYPEWFVEHLRAIEAQPSSEPMTADEAMARLDVLTQGEATKVKLSRKTVR